MSVLVANQGFRDIVTRLCDFIPDPLMELMRIVSIVQSCEKVWGPQLRCALPYPFTAMVAQCVRALVRRSAKYERCKYLLLSHEHHASVVP